MYTQSCSLSKLLVDADTVVTGVAAAEEQHLKLLHLLLWHKLLLL